MFCHLSFASYDRPGFSVRRRDEENAQVATQGVKSDNRSKAAAAPPIGIVLVVEDDAILALNIEETLLGAGATRVIQCNSSDDALAALRTHQPDAMILDVHLSDRDDGWALAELVSSVGPKPPRIVFSTGAPQDIPANIAELGPVLEKPYAPEDLLAAIQTRPGAIGLFSRLKSVLR